MTPLEHLLRQMQGEIDNLKRDVRDLKDENRRLRTVMGARSNDMQFCKV